MRRCYCVTCIPYDASGGGSQQRPSRQCEGCTARGVSLPCSQKGLAPFAKPSQLASQSATLPAATPGSGEPWMVSGTAPAHPHRDPLCRILSLVDPAVPERSQISRTWTRHMRWRATWYVVESQKERTPPGSFTTAEHPTSFGCLPGGSRFLDAGERSPDLCLANPVEPISTPASASRLFASGEESMRSATSPHLKVVAGAEFPSATKYTALFSCVIDHRGTLRYSPLMFPLDVGETFARGATAWSRSWCNPSRQFVLLFSTTLEPSEP